jgi:hypothetical protein
MRAYWHSLQDALIDRTPAQWIGAIALAVVLALAATGLYHLLIHKVRDSVMLMTGVVVLACAVAMALTAGFLREQRRLVYGVRVSPPHMMAAWARAHGEPDARQTRRLFERADADHDGILSTAEASAAAAALLQESTRDTNGRVAGDRLGDVLQAFALLRGQRVRGLPPSREALEAWQNQRRRAAHGNGAPR